MSGGKPTSKTNAGWLPTTIGALGRLYCGQSPPSAQVNTKGQGTLYVSGPEQWDGYTVHQNKWTTAASRVAPAASIFITVKGSGVGTLFPGVAAAIGRDIYAFEAHRGIDYGFMHRALQYSIQDVVTKARGDIPGLSKGHILDHPISIPGASTQRRIASKIDELFSSIGAGERALRRVKKLVQLYRQSVLKAAVTGELTREWRERHKAELEPGEALLARILRARRAAWETFELDKMIFKGVKIEDDKWKQKYQTPGEPVTDYLGELPSEWQKVRVDAVGEVQLGRQRSPAHHTGEFMRPYLRVANVYEERIDTSDVMSMNFTPEEFQTYALRSGDLLLNEGQSKELVGRPAIYRDEVPGVCFTNTIVRFRATQVVLPEFALMVFLHYMKSGYFQKIAKITTNMAHLGAGRFAEMSFPVPSIDEQREIVDRLERQSSVYDRFTADISERDQQVGSLRQSVLKAAFAGSLVTQDHTDESGAVLLQRIAADRSKADGTRRGHKKRGEAA